MASSPSHRLPAHRWHRMSDSVYIELDSMTAAQQTPCTVEGPIKVSLSMSTIVFLIALISRHVILYDFFSSRESLKLSEVVVLSEMCSSDDHKVTIGGFPGGSVVKNRRRCGFDPWVRKIP